MSTPATWCSIRPPHDEELRYIYIHHPAASRHWDVVRLGTGGHGDWAHYRTYHGRQPRDGGPGAPAPGSLPLVRLGSAWHGRIPSTAFWLDGYPQHLTVSSPQLTTQPNGTARACVTVQQPGLEVMASLHAEVDDPAGHPAVAREAPGTGGGRRMRAWSVDTTVAIWEVVHHQPMDGAEDTSKHEPVRTSVSLDTPVGKP